MTLLKKKNCIMWPVGNNLIYFVVSHGFINNCFTCQFSKHVGSESTHAIETDTSCTAELTGFASPGSKMIMIVDWNTT